jgi:hypothetical protein
MRVFYKFWHDLMKSYNGWFNFLIFIFFKKKLKEEYPKLTLFKVWAPYFKNDERSRVISKVLPIFYKLTY